MPPTIRLPYIGILFKPFGRAAPIITGKLIKYYIQLILFKNLPKAQATRAAINTTRNIFVILISGKLAFIYNLKSD